MAWFHKQVMITLNCLTGKITSCIFSVIIGLYSFVLPIFQEPSQKDLVSEILSLSLVFARDSEVHL